MGVDASYKVPYCKGLLKLIQKRLALGQHYLCSPQMSLEMKRGSNKESIDAKHISIEICATNTNPDELDELGYSSRSTILLFPEKGMLLVDDGCRYYDRDGSNSNREYNEMAAAYYENILNELGASFPYVHICPDYDYAYDDYEEKFPIEIIGPLSSKLLLLELPIEIMTDEERAEFVSVFGEIPTYSNDIATAIRECGNEKLLEEILHDQPKESLLNWLKCAVLARNTTCVNLISKKVGAEIPSHLFDIALEQCDEKTMDVLVRNKYKPTLKQLYNVAKFHDIGVFSLILEGYVNGAILDEDSDDENIPNDKILMMAKYNQLVEKEENYGTPYMKVHSLACKVKSVMPNVQFT